MINVPHRSPQRVLRRPNDIGIAAEDCVDSNTTPMEPQRLRRPRVILGPVYSSGAIGAETTTARRLVPADVVEACSLTTEQADWLDARISQHESMAIPLSSHKPSVFHAESHTNSTVYLVRVK